MSNHRFEVVQTVVVPWIGQVASVMPSGSYVTRLLPLVGGEPRYHAKCAADWRKWSLAESQMGPASQPV
jgi:hypothetical protein